MAGAFGFSVYLAYAPDYAVTYGAFAGVIVTLLFFYLTGAAVIFGAEVNAALMAFRQRRAERLRASWWPGGRRWPRRVLRVLRVHATWRPHPNLRIQTAR